MGQGDGGNERMWDRGTAAMSVCGTGKLAVSLCGTGGRRQ